MTRLPRIPTRAIVILIASMNVGLAVNLVAPTSLPLVGSQNAGGCPIDAHRVYLWHRLGYAVFIDARPQQDFGRERVAGALHATAEEDPVELGRLLRNTPRNRPLVVYGKGCGACKRPARIVAALRKAGFTRIWTLAGGLRAWKQEGYPTESEPAHRRGGGAAIPGCRWSNARQ